MCAQHQEVTDIVCNHVLQAQRRKINSHYPYPGSFETLLYSSTCLIVMHTHMYINSLAVTCFHPIFHEHTTGTCNLRQLTNQHTCNYIPVHRSTPVATYHTYACSALHIFVFIGCAHVPFEHTQFISVFKKYTLNISTTIQCSSTRAYERLICKFKWVFNSSLVKRQTRIR